MGNAGRKGGLALLAALCITLSACAPGGGRVLDVSGEKAAMTEAIDGFFAALDTRDGEAVAALFSPDVRQRDKDLDGQIQRLLEVYPGPTDWYDWESDGATQNVSGGARSHLAYGTVHAVCNGEDYWCWVSLMYKNSLSEKVGVSSIRFFTAEEICGVRYDDWDVPKEDGLSVYAGRTLPCEVRSIEEKAFKYTPPPAPLDLGEAADFLAGSSRYDDFAARFGEPCAEDEVWRYYELPPEDGEPRYLRLSVAHDGEIHAMSLADHRRWLGWFFLDESRNSMAAKSNPEVPVFKRADGTVEIHK